MIGLLFGGCTVILFQNCADIRVVKPNVPESKVQPSLEEPPVVPSPVASPSPTPVPSPVASPSPTPVPSPVASPSPTPVPSPVASPRPSPVPSPGGDIIVGGGEQSGGVYHGGPNDGSRNGFRYDGTPRRVVAGADNFIMSGHCPYFGVRMTTIQGTTYVQRGSSGGLWLMDINGRILNTASPCYDEVQNVGVEGEQVITQEEAVMARTSCEGCNFTPAGAEAGLLYKNDQAIYYLARYGILKYAITSIANSKRLVLVKRHSFITAYSGIRNFDGGESILDTGSGILVKRQSTSGIKWTLFDYNLTNQNEINLSAQWVLSNKILAALPANNILPILGLTETIPPTLTPIQLGNLTLGGRMPGVASGVSQTAVYLNTDVQILDSKTHHVVRSVHNIQLPNIGNDGLPPALTSSKVGSKAYRDDGLFYVRCRLFDISGPTPTIIPLPLPAPNTPTGELSDLVCSYYLGALHPSGHAVFVNAFSDSGFGIYHYMLPRN